jgi:hypothetical protein
MSCVKVLLNPSPIELSTLRRRDTTQAHLCNMPFLEGARDFTITRSPMTDIAGDANYYGGGKVILFYCNIEGLTSCCACKARQRSYHYGDNIQGPITNVSGRNNTNTVNSHQDFSSGGSDLQSNDPAVILLLLCLTISQRSTCQTRSTPSRACC